MGVWAQPSIKYTKEGRGATPRADECSELPRAKGLLCPCPLARIRTQAKAQALPHPEPKART